MSGGDDTVLLVCAIVGDPLTDEMAGSVRGHYCTICAVEICMSPRMAAYWELNPKAQPICARCSVGTIDEDDDARVAALPGDQVGERDVQAIQAGLRRYYSDGRG